MDLVDLFGTGRLAVGLGAIVLARPAARLLGLTSGRSLGERSGLALAGTGRLVELMAEALVLGLQVMKASMKGLAAGTRDGLHTCCKPGSEITRRGSVFGGHLGAKLPVPGQRGYNARAVRNGRM